MHEQGACGRLTGPQKILRSYQGFRRLSELTKNFGQAQFDSVIARSEDQRNPLFGFRFLEPPPAGKDFSRMNPERSLPGG